MYAFFQYSHYSYSCKISTANRDTAIQEELQPHPTPASTLQETVQKRCSASTPGSRAIEERVRYILAMWELTEAT